MQLAQLTRQRGTYALLSETQQRQLLERYEKYGISGQGGQICGTGAGVAEEALVDDAAGRDAIPEAGEEVLKMGALPGDIVQVV